MDVIEWLYGLQHCGIKLGLDNIRALLDALGHPERAYRSVLVGGTNGKGSVAAMLHEMLLASGARSGLYTSPHLMRPEERIRLGGTDIDGAELGRRLVALRERIDGGLAAGRLAAHPSFFEVVTATALEAFRDHGVAVAVLEVGLGGALDATNAVDADVAVVVGVDLDHTKTLGATVREIAVEKAGIVKPERPLVNGAVRQAALDVLRATARRRNAPFVDARNAVRLLEARNGAITFDTRLGRIEDLRLGLEGRHQIDNARIAISAFETLAPRLGVEPTPAAIGTGLARVRWPGRLQWVRRPGHPNLLLDGAHNPAGARALAGYLRALGGQPPPVVFAAMEDKPATTILETLAPVVGPMIVTRPAVARAAATEAIAAVARAHLAHVEVVEPVPAALERAEALAGASGRVLVTGSLYLVGEVLAALEGAGAPGPVSS